MKYLVQIVLSSNTNLDILTRDTIDILHKAGFGQIEVIKGVSHYQKEKMDMTIIQFEFITVGRNEGPIDFIHRISNNKFKNYRIRIFKLEY